VIFQKTTLEIWQLDNPKKPHILSHFDLKKTNLLNLARQKKALCG
jgi:hypothetical protein